MRRKFTLGEFIFRSIKVHGHKYNYDKSHYIDIKTTLIIGCPIHGDFVQSPDSHIHGRGCPKCGGNVRLDTTQFIERSTNIHAIKYDYSRVKYKSSTTKVAIFCPKHGKFLQLPNDHLRGCGCPKCQMSRGENKIIKFLERMNISYEHQYWFADCRSDIGKRQVLRFDFFIPSKNILIEFDGKQHFEIGRLGNHNQTQDDLEYIQHHDSIKTKYARHKGISLFRIKYTKINKVDEILMDTLKVKS